jgi:arylformamidase
MTLPSLTADKDLVFLHYTQAELDRNFDQRGWVDNAEAILARCIARSHEVRDRLAHLADVSYGPGRDEVLDIFQARRAGAPVCLFVHGGAWRNFTKDDYALIAAPLVAAGITAVVLNFSKVPAVRLPEVVAQVQRGLAWVHQNAESFGGDRSRLFLVGHSSGAHLAAAALTVPMSNGGVLDAGVGGAILISGAYDLEPVMLSARSSYLHISKEEERELSPMRHVERLRCPILVAYAEGDTDEFQRQSREFTDTLENAGRLWKALVLPGLNHFETIEALGTADSVIIRTIVDCVIGEAA